jgi:DNA-binding MarR family transcriptional regulator
MESDEAREAREEAAVLAKLRKRPLYSLELADALAEDPSLVRDAVQRLDAGGLIRPREGDGRFEIAPART